MEEAFDGRSIVKLTYPPTFEFKLQNSLEAFPTLVESWKLAFFLYDRTHSKVFLIVSSLKSSHRSSEPASPAFWTLLEKLSTPSLVEHRIRTLPPLLLRDALWVFSRYFAYLSLSMVQSFIRVFLNFVFFFSKCILLEHVIGGAGRSGIFFHSALWIFAPRTARCLA